MDKSSKTEKGVWVQASVLQLSDTQMKTRIDSELWACFEQ